ncbi:MAG: 3-deoxy-7-phosphoheptulonate synthase [Candidatus Latescibacteria bacterium]|nr:3-deoxy-7-phosphoheptulonate synthase [Candidatus Latescibacterota bacterium]NIM64402.1 3-deoxy-7-phosphoheptulonate synthase [Candidatus Latescibacterota bacterium]NIO00556.1 3-deoxy-7-phosphoheptulonate synthase [Candidatus Latescibacterota bacterium]NIO26956.1 3-deoxy-7-phosphoheptulonate synthase [Candidatus Latescibacterota bacterium]NIO56033.1 3-deoxy-7-phosphoheptulonate synthase [Candidatus Latescibacterota bacterium]
MLVVMKTDASVSETDDVIQKIESLGLKPQASRNADHAVISIVGSNENIELSHIQAMPGVAQIIPSADPFTLVTLKHKPERTIVNAGDVPIGGEEFVVMAGPCAVESHEQAMSTAKMVHEAGARILRGGAFKPRSSPYSFQGLGEDALKILLAAKRETGLPIVTEVITPELVPVVSEYADILQIGSRNMQNYFLLEAAGKANKPILLKRGMMSTIEELLLAAEYVLANGNNQVILCERGIRTFEKATRNTLDISAVPVLKHSCHLPVIVDPSHATGRREYIPAAAKAAVAAGADGILVEVHPSPEHALSDGIQSLSFGEFKTMMDEIRRIAAAVGRRVGTADR